MENAKSGNRDGFDKSCIVQEFRREGKIKIHKGEKNKLNPLQKTLLHPARDRYRTTSLELKIGILNSRIARPPARMCTVILPVRSLARPSYTASKHFKEY